MTSATSAEFRGMRLAKRAWIFEKSFSMAQNLAIQRQQSIDDFWTFVVDLAEDTWDWNNGEPPPSNPAYYVRFMKTFSRMGGTLRYIQCDNRA